MEIRRIFLRPFLKDVLGIYSDRKYKYEKCISTNNSGRGSGRDLFGMPRLDLIRRGNDKKRRRKEKDG
jgi:hypothetical protein